VSAMGFIIGKKVGAQPGSRIAVDLTGPTEHTILVEVPEGAGSRAAVVEELSAPPTVTLRMPAGVFARLAGGRVEPATVRQQVELEGDTELGGRILDNLAYTI